MGSRDAAPTQLAFLAALWAEEKTAAHARVLPDGTELSLLCNTQANGLASCVEQLTRALNLTTPTESEMQRLRTRLKQRRERARAEGIRAVDELAFTALFEDVAPSLFPMGQEVDDSRVESGALQGFFADFYRPARALLIGAGDVNEAELSRAFSRASSKTLAPASPRTTFAPPSRSRVLVAAGQNSWLAFVLSAPSGEEAAAVAFQVQRLYPQATAQISALRGAHLVHVRMPGGDRPLRRLQRAVFDLRRLALETRSFDTPRAKETLENITRLLGEDWAARGPNQNVPTPWPLGIGIVWNVDGLSASDADKKLQEIAKEAQAAMARGEANTRGDLRGTVDHERASASLENGARVEVRKRAADAWMSGVVRLAGGSEQDSLTRHGRAALLATLMADSCKFTHREGLDEALLSREVTLTPLVSPQHVGLLVSAPSAKWADALDSAVRCVLGPSLTSRALEDARVKLLRTLWTRPELRLQSALGHLVSPHAPGIAAPWGSLQTVSSVHINEVRRLHAELLVGSRVSVLAVTNQDATTVARFIARRLSQLASGTAPAKLVWGPMETMRGEWTESGPLRAVIGMRAEQRGADPLAAHVFAEALAEKLEKKGLPSRAILAQVSDSVAVSGVALEISEESLLGMEAAVKSALQDLEALPQQELTRRLEQAELQRSASRSSATGYARAYFEGTLELEPAPEPWGDLFRKLAKAKAGYFILRPRP